MIFTENSASNYKVVCGEHSRRIDNEEFEVVMDVASFHIHPRYFDPEVGYDIAVVNVTSFHHTAQYTFQLYYENTIGYQ